jgi:DNA repair protein SbcC/Rad50
VRTTERRREIESEVDEIEGRIAEIDTELGEEAARKTRLAETESHLVNLTAVRAAQETALAGLRKSAAVLEEQRRSADALSGTIEKARAALSGLQARLAARQTERAIHAGLIERAAEIESGYSEWQKSRKELEKLEKVALEFREYESQRQPFLREIDSERARLEQEQKSLSDQFTMIAQQASMTGELQEQLKAAQLALEEATSRVTECKTVEAQLQAGREKQAELKAGNETLRAAMLPMDERIKKLETTTEGKCPLCDQDLTPKHRLETIERLKSEGREMGDLFRANKISLEELAASLIKLEKNLREYSDAESRQLARSNEVAQLTERIGTLERQSTEWEKTGAKRLVVIENLLKEGEYSGEARKQLAKLDKELAKLGYDASAHDDVRRAEASGRNAEEEFSNLKSAREVMKQMEGEISNLETDIANRVSEIDAQDKQFNNIFQVLKEAEAQAPNLDQAERELLRLREQENQARDEVTRARQLVDVLVSLRQRREGHTADREEKQKLIARHKTLERAFGKDGVPALLIEQALPQIETKANDLLDRLSDGRMSIKFTTMAEYKDKKREDLKETLDIQISDGAGLRDYEMYSGGEAFRVNFAIRLALSEVLAQRKGARLQTLVIDEGFGSQDAQGRQRLIEAINTVRGDFAKILVITHLDELKDAFPTRIEVEKTERGSTVKII